MRGHQRQARRRRFQKGQSEGLRECRIHENALPLGSPAVEPGDLRSLVSFRVGSDAVEISVVNAPQELHPHLAGAGRKLVDPLAVAADDDEVRIFPKPLVPRERSDEAGEVLPFVGTGDGQHRGLRWIAEECRELGIDGRRHLRRARAIEP